MRNIFLDAVIGAGALLLLIVLGFSVVFGYSIRAKHKSRSKGPPSELKLKQNIRIDDSTLRQLLYQLDPNETEIRWADRLHIMSVLPAIISLLIVAAIPIVAGGAGAHYAGRLHELTIPGHNTPRGEVPDQHFSLGFLPYVSVAAGVLLALPLIFLAWSLFLRWRSQFRLASNKNFIRKIQPWPWAFWLRKTESYRPLSYEIITNVEIDNTLLGDALGYCILTIDFWNQEGKRNEFDHIPYVKDGESLRAVIQRGREEARQDGNIARPNPAVHR